MLQKILGFERNGMVTDNKYVLIYALCTGKLGLRISLETKLQITLFNAQVMRFCFVVWFSVVCSQGVLSARRSFGRFQMESKPIQ
jgi:hypothetical protein